MEIEAGAAGASLVALSGAAGAALKLNGMDWQALSRLHANRAMVRRVGVIGLSKSAIQDTEELRQVLLTCLLIDRWLGILSARAEFTGPNHSLSGIGVNVSY